MKLRFMSVVGLVTSVDKALNLHLAFNDAPQCLNKQFKEASESFHPNSNVFCVVKL